jgi:hypothetical protein
MIAQTYQVINTELVPMSAISQISQALCRYAQDLKSKNANTRFERKIQSRTRSAGGYKIMRKRSTRI